MDLRLATERWSSTCNVHKCRGLPVKLNAEKNKVAKISKEKWKWKKMKLDNWSSEIIDEWVNDKIKRKNSATNKMLGSEDGGWQWDTIKAIKMIYITHYIVDCLMIKRWKEVKQKEKKKDLTVNPR